MTSATSPLPPLIALYSPRNGMGKTTCARYLEKRYGFYRVSVADAVRRAVAPFINDYSSEYRPDLAWIATRAHPHKDTVIQALGCTPRELLVAFGEGARAHIRPTFWAELLMKQVDIIRRGGRRPSDGSFPGHVGCGEEFPPFPVVIDDARFPTEFEAIKAAGGRVLALVDPQNPAPPDVPSDYPRIPALRGGRTMYALDSFMRYNGMGARDSLVREYGFHSE